MDGRLPGGFISGGNDIQSSSTSITITDPFILYQNYVAQGMLKKDESQLRVMKEFQKLYFRLKDYKPPDELKIKINLLIRKMEIKRAEEIAKGKGFQDGSSSSGTFFKLSNFQNMFRADPEAQKKELIRVITDEEELYSMASPQGLLLNGEVGCGKSMLMDIFASSLPLESKMRWHYNNFILWVFNEMHNIQKERLFTSAMMTKELTEQLLLSQRLSMENEFVLFEIAQKLIGKSTILMLDEFMLPDIAAASIVKILFTYYFKLGGVLVATSNKLPEDLYSNEFHKKNFKSFVSILHNRCQTVDMRSEKDYRILNCEPNEVERNLVVKSENDGKHNEIWKELIEGLVGGPIVDGTPNHIQVYNRTTYIPLTYKNNTICYLDFLHICEGLFSASDYITLASTYRTVILDNVPIMTLKMKNEARRFITLLDAIYEAKCQFYMRSEVEVLRLFFPDENSEGSDVNNIQVQNEEMFAKTVMDLESPYRPNVSYYTGGNTEFVEGKRKQVNTARNYQNTSAFTGEDEKFAYKRAVLRIQEMVGSKQWSKNQWVPIDESMRPWECVETTNFEPIAINRVQLDSKDPPTKIDLQHIWSMGHWTKLNGRRIKDEITRKWIRSGMRD